MIIKKHAESNMDESAFYGKVEVETDTKIEWETVIRILETIHEDSCVCHCKLKENAELIAAILDFDVENKVAPFFCSEREPMINKIERHVAVLSLNPEDENTLYMTFPDGLRLIFDHGEYVGWYVCGEG